MKRGMPPAIEKTFDKQGLNICNLSLPTSPEQWDNYCTSCTQPPALCVCLCVGGGGEEEDSTDLSGPL